MIQDAVQIFRMLVEAGATPGEDFSCDLSSQSCRISERGFILLQSAFPEVDWHTVVQVVERDMETPAHALNEALGLNFIARILQRTEERLQSLSQADAAWYVQQIFTGVEHRTGVSLYHFWQRQAGPVLQCQVDNLFREPLATPCHHWIGDLIWAAGGEEDDYQIRGDDVLLSDRGMALLAQVWAGEYELLEDDADVA
jgi:hypothetical protein